MRKTKEVLRLYYEQNLKQRQIARAANVSQSTVHEYLVRAKAAGLQWPLPDDWDEQRLTAALFPVNAENKTPPKRPLPDFPHFRPADGTASRADAGTAVGKVSRPTS